MFEGAVNKKMFMHKFVYNISGLTNENEGVIIQTYGMLTLSLYIRMGVLL